MPPGEMGRVENVYHMNPFWTLTFNLGYPLEFSTVSFPFESIRMTISGCSGRSPGQYSDTNTASCCCALVSFSVWLKG